MLITALPTAPASLLELSAVSAERENVRIRQGELVQACAELKQAKRGLEIEKGDVLDAYRSVLQEKRKLEMDVQAIGYL